MIENFERQSLFSTSQDKAFLNYLVLNSQRVHFPVVNMTYN